jgi:cytosine/adenosine deaminase-related metal-dependent hydrolase
MSAMRMRGATLVTWEGTNQVDLSVSTPESAARMSRKFDVDLRDHLIFPGLANAHDHLQVNCIPPMPQSVPYPNSYEWARDFDRYRRTATVTAALTADLELRFRHGALKNLLAGTTFVAHHDPVPPVAAELEWPVRTLRDFGWSHSLGLGEPSLVPEGMSQYGPAVSESFAATPKEWPWMIHLGEGTDELAASELTRLDSMGCLAANTVLIHGVGLTDEQTDRVLDAGASVVWCPSSNLRILGRTLDPRRLFDRDRLLLGTDSRLSGSRDLLEEFRVAAEHSDLTARELFRMATKTAAERLRVPRSGPMEQGWAIDLIVLRNGGGDPFEQLLAAQRKDLRMVIQGGLPAVGDLDLADWFAASGVAACGIELDGRAKLMAATLEAPAALEPGLTLESACA